MKTLERFTPMRRFRGLRIGLLVAAACERNTAGLPSAATQTTSLIVASDQAAAYRTLDDDFADLTDDIPGFGGMFFDSAGTLRVYLKDPGTVSAASPKMAAFLERGVKRGAKRSAEYAEKVAAMWPLQARFDFKELLSIYRTQINPLVVEVEGITITDINDRTNRILIGVADAAMIGPVRDRLAKLPIPADAVEVVQFAGPTLQSGRVPLGTARPRSTAFFTQSLQGDLRPAIPGGAQIGGSYQGNYVATLAFNLVPSFGTDRFLVTCSHCARPIFEMNGVGLGQPTWSGQVATEVLDPTQFQGAPCPAQKLCRYSEAALVRYDAPGVADQGQVALPPIGSTLFSTRTTIVGMESPYVGEPVHMIGSQSGRTWGYVDYACADAPYPGVPQWRMLCQARATYSSQDGDSGSPIIALHTDGTSHGMGIHWAGPGWFSILYEALDELYTRSNGLYGVMDPTGAPPPPPPPPPPLNITLTGPASVRSGATCLWTATPTNGVAPYSYSWNLPNGSSTPGELLYQNSGSNFTVSVQVHDAAGASGSNSKSVTISGSAPICYF